MPCNTIQYNATHHSTVQYSALRRLMVAILCDYPVHYVAEVQRGRFSLLLGLAHQAQQVPVLAHTICQASCIGGHLQAGLRSSDSLDRKRARQALEDILQLPVDHCSPASESWHAFLSMLDALDMFDVTLVRGVWKPHWSTLLKSCYSLQQASLPAGGGGGEPVVADEKQNLAEALVGGGENFSPHTSASASAAAQSAVFVPAGIEREGPRWPWLSVLTTPQFNCLPLKR
jgi:hypothetical protein